mmetsp:Transcript_90772/g.256324  ORF Transcript_90772/g.256324 Transcript_90772/m.256324 type:complete len:330 (-) Transcript_90772:464-1453(-)
MTASPHPKVPWSAARRVVQTASERGPANSSTSATHARGPTASPPVALPTSASSGVPAHASDGEPPEHGTAVTPLQVALASAMPPPSPASCELRRLSVATPAMLQRKPPSGDASLVPASVWACAFSPSGTSPAPQSRGSSTTPSPKVAATSPVATLLGPATSTTPSPEVAATPPLATLLDPMTSTTPSLEVAATSPVATLLDPELAPWPEAAAAWSMATTSRLPRRLRLPLSALSALSALSFCAAEASSGAMGHHFFLSQTRQQAKPQRCESRANHEPHTESCPNTRTSSGYIDLASAGVTGLSSAGVLTLLAGASSLSSSITSMPSDFA